MGKNEHSSKISGSLFTYFGALFRRHDVEAVLVGGYALNANNVQRTTFDIDFMLTAGDLSRIETEILGADYFVFNRQESFVQFRSEKSGLRDVDFLLSDAHTVRSLIEQGRDVVIAGEKFYVPSPQHLIAMKVHSIAGNSARMLKDLPDIVLLMKANSIDPNDGAIKDIFAGSKAPDLYRRVLEAMTGG
jgi:hypothetical protein